MNISEQIRYYKYEDMVLAKCGPTNAPRDIFIYHVSGEWKRLTVNDKLWASLFGDIRSRSQTLSKEEMKNRHVKIIKNRAPDITKKMFEE